MPRAGRLAVRAWVRCFSRRRRRCWVRWCPVLPEARRPWRRIAARGRRLTCSNNTLKGNSASKATRSRHPCHPQAFLSCGGSGSATGSAGLQSANMGAGPGTRRCGCRPAGILGLAPAWRRAGRPATGHGGRHSPGLLGGGEGRGQQSSAARPEGQRSSRTWLLSSALPPLSPPPPPPPPPPPLPPQSSFREPPLLPPPLAAAASGMTLRRCLRRAGARGAQHSTALASASACMQAACMRAFGAGPPGGFAAARATPLCPPAPRSGKCGAAQRWERALGAPGNTAVSVPAGAPAAEMHARAARPQQAR